MPLSISVTNLIVIAIVAVILFFAVRSSIRHLHGEGGCCGGSTYKAPPQKAGSCGANQNLFRGRDDLPALCQPRDGRRQLHRRGIRLGASKKGHCHRIYGASR